MSVDVTVEKPIFLIDYAAGMPDTAPEKPFVETFAEESGRAPRDTDFAGDDGYAVRGQNRRTADRQKPRLQ